MESFEQRVLKVVREIPSGSTLTYKEVAEKAGNPKAYRVVGNVLRGNFDPNIPCHRVVLSDGGVGGYNRGKETKTKLLKKEGAL